MLWSCGQKWGYLQYCAKIMQAIIVEYRENHDISRYLKLINFKRYMERYIVTAIVLFLGKISFTLSDKSFAFSNISFSPSDISFSLSNTLF